MISCKLQGGMANCAIQISSIYALALKNNADFAVDLASYTPLQGFQATKYADNIFKNVPQLKTAPVYHYCYMEPRFNYTELPFQDSCIYEGFFQSYKYWLGYEKEIKELFSIPSPIKECSPYTLTGIHVRRGDYKNNPDIYPLCSIDYYNQAIAMLGGDFVVVSDDIEWCRKNFLHSRVEFSNFDNEIDDFRLLANCDNVITANSTFSMMAAWLNPNPDKKVICPNKWFNHGGPDSSDIIPPEFIQI